MIYADFKSILVPEDKKKQNPDYLIGINNKVMLAAVLVIT